MSSSDPKTRPGAYITDGSGLYEVVGLRRGPGVLGMSTVRIAVQDCRNLRDLEFLPNKIGDDFELVRRAPVPRCPDVPDNIPWDGDLAA